MHTRAIDEVYDQGTQSRPGDLLTTRLYLVITYIGKKKQIVYYTIVSQKIFITIVVTIVKMKFISINLYTKHKNVIKSRFFL